MAVDIFAETTFLNAIIKRHTTGTGQADVEA